MHKHIGNSRIHQVSKRYSKLKNGNTRSNYQFKFKDGTMVFAGNSNVGLKGGNWKVCNKVPKKTFY